MNKEIIIRNAYENNLKHIDLNIPLNAFTCVTGCSGSGKSSLVFDTIYAESQRRFFDGMTGNLNSQKLMNKPKVGLIENLYPAINIAQNYYNVNPRSTIGTVTEISYYLRSLFSILNRVPENIFSTNNPEAYCKNCYGLGVESVISEALLIPDVEKTLREGAIAYFKGPPDSKEQKYLEALCEYYRIDIDKRIKELSRNDIEKLLYADENVYQKISFKDGRKRKQVKICLNGAIVDILKKVKYNETSIYQKFMEEKVCHVCGGSKLREEILRYKVNGLNYSEVENLELNELKEWLYKFSSSKIDSYKEEPVLEIIGTILTKIESLLKLKLGYLSLSRSIPSLSGGELQRIRMAVQLTCSLKGLTYILDEPCKGLHFRDIQSIIEATRNLILNDSTVIAIEHNLQYIATADNVIELGPVGGPAGGYIVKTKKLIPKKIPSKNPEFPEKFFELHKINFRNIREQDVKIPIGKITFITGVSGSGKSSLTRVIANCFERKKNISCESFDNWEAVKRVIEVNQYPIGKTSRSTVISYLGIYDEIRLLFSQTPVAKKLKLTPSSFSMNVKGGRCECCQGTGLQKIELKYLQDFYVTCPECEGKRFSPEILSVSYKNKNIQEILDTQILEIANLFVEHKKIYGVLESMMNLGLGYLTLGQMSMNLSGGEAQRIKLAKALGVTSIGNNLYIFDEPTSGLNETDIEKLSKNLLMLKEKNETVLIIEHDIDFVLKLADYVLDFGIYGGQKGGKISAWGLPLDVLKNSASSIYNYKREIEKCKK